MKLFLKVNFNVIPRVYFIDGSGKHCEVNIPQNVFEEVRKRATNLLSDMLYEITVRKTEKGYYEIK